MTRRPAAGRQQEIRELIDKGQCISVGALADTYGVSTETIRRDLLALDSSGAIKRVFGGAVPVDRKAPVEERVKSLSREKDTIARLVSPLVEPDQLLFLTAGSTSMAVAKALREGPPVSVMTNMPAIADVLASGTGHRIYLTGGEYMPQNASLVGPPVLASISSCVFDLAIIGVFGIDARYGLVDSEQYNQELKNRIVERSRSNILTADNSKFGASGQFQGVPLSKVDLLVTDRRPHTAFRRLFSEAGVKILHPENQHRTEV